MVYSSFRGVVLLVRYGVIIPNSSKFVVTYCIRLHYHRPTVSCPCCCLDHFVAGSEYLKTFFLSLGKKYKDRYERYDATNKFHNNKENQNIILDGEFAKF